MLRVRGAEKLFKMEDETTQSLLKINRFMDFGKTTIQSRWFKPY
jgi:hypothetical protein